MLVHCFAGCDALDVLAELRRRGLLETSNGDNPPRRSERPAVPLPSQEPEPDERALELWRKAIPAAGTLAEQYLRARHITLQIPPSIRFLPYVDYMPRIGFPAIVAAVQRPDRAVAAVQITYLDPSGKQKAKVANPRKTIGKLGTGAVRLGAADTSLGLAEGIETALSAMQLANVPVWACLGSNRMDAVTVPSHVASLCVFGDNDPSGRDAAQKTLERHRAQREVFAQIPPTGDWNDYLCKTELVTC
ncbi:MAG: toprim domain-containing protein [Methylocella sp.]